MGDLFIFCPRFDLLGGWENTIETLIPLFTIFLRIGTANSDVPKKMIFVIYTINF